MSKIYYFEKFSNHTYINNIFQYKNKSSRLALAKGTLSIANKILARFIKETKQNAYFFVLKQI